MIETGRVARTKDGVAVVRFPRHGECDKCLICDVSKDGTMCELSVPNTVGASTGDEVKVELYKKRALLKTILLYACVLVLTAVGAGIGTLMSTAASVILAVAGFVVGLAFAVPIDVCVIRKKHKPQIVEVLSGDEIAKQQVDSADSYE